MCPAHSAHGKWNTMYEVTKARNSRCGTIPIPSILARADRKACARQLETLARTSGGRTYVDRDNGGRIRDRRRHHGKPARPVRDHVCLGAVSDGCGVAESEGEPRQRRAGSDILRLAGLFDGDTCDDCDPCRAICTARRGGDGAHRADWVRNVTSVIGLAGAWTSVSAGGRILVQLGLF